MLSTSQPDAASVWTTRSATAPGADCGDLLLGRPVLLRAGRCVAAVHGELRVDCDARRFAEPRAPNEDARTGPTRPAVRVR